MTPIRVNIVGPPSWTSDNDLKSMSVDELWKLHEEVTAELAQKLIAPVTGWAPGGINLASAVYMGNNASKSTLLMAASHRAFIDAISSASGSAHTGATQLMIRSRANDTSEMRFTFASHL